MTDNSVMGILQECESMLQINCDCRINVMLVKKDLQKAMQSLKSKYSENKIYNDSVINKLKSECNKQAIRLEYCLSDIDYKFGRRYKLRCEVKDIMILLNNRIDKLRKEGDYFVICQVLQDYSFVENIYQQSENISFELDTDEVNRLRAIKSKEVE